MYKYIATKEEYYDCDIGYYDSYSIITLDDWGNIVAKVDDVSSDRDFIRKVLDFFGCLRISPIHLQEAVVELISNPDSVFLKVL